MKQFVRLTFSSGHVYEVPAQLIAANRAAAMQALHPSEFPTIEDAMADTVEYFTDNNSMIADWAQGNMNWPEIEPHARLIRFTPPTLDHASECEWSHHDDRGIMAELGDDITLMPVELVLNTMALQNQLCNVTVLQHGGQGFAALAMVIGSQPVLNTYIQAIEFTTNMLQKPAMPAGATSESPQYIH